MLSALVAIVLHAPTPAAPAETVNVFAAASLSDAFKAIALKFEARHPGWHVALNFAGMTL